VQCYVISDEKLANSQLSLPQKLKKKEIQKRNKTVIQSIKNGPKHKAVCLVISILTEIKLNWSQTLQEHLSQSSAVYGGVNVTFNSTRVKGGQSNVI